MTSLDRLTQPLPLLAPLLLLLPLTGTSPMGAGQASTRHDRVEPSPSLAEQTTVDDEEEPKDWRDRSKPELRKAWDNLEGKPAPSLSGLVDWSTKSGHSWTDFRGKVVLVDFWATWCSPCREEIPKIQALHEKLGEKGFVALGVHAPRGREKMSNFIKEQGLSYAFAADAEGAFYEQFHIELIPTYMVVDRRGVLRVAGANRAKISEIVEALLAEPVPSADELEAPQWPATDHKKELYADRDLRGKPAPELHFGEWLTAAPDRKGKVVLIDFWATWCPPCRKAIPDLNELHEAFGEDLVVIGLSKEEQQVVRDFTKETKMEYALACDPSGKLSEAVGVQGIPHVLLISSDGIVRWQGFPLDEKYPLTSEVVAQVLDADPGVRARRKAREEARAKASAEVEKDKDSGGQFGLGMD